MPDIDPGVYVCPILIRCVCVPFINPDVYVCPILIQVCMCALCAYTFILLQDIRLLQDIQLLQLDSTP